MPTKIRRPAVTSGAGLRRRQFFPPQETDGDFAVGPPEEAPRLPSPPPFESQSRLTRACSEPTIVRMNPGGKEGQCIYER